MGDIAGGGGAPSAGNSQDHRSDDIGQYPGRTTVGTVIVFCGPRPAEIQDVVVVLQGTKIVQAKFVSRCFNFKGFTIMVMSTNKQHCGGVALAVWGNSLFRVENERITLAPMLHVSIELAVAEDERWFFIGCYFPPSDRGRCTTASAIYPGSWREPPWT